MKTLKLTRGLWLAKKDGVKCRFSQMIDALLWLRGEL